MARWVAHKTSLLIIAPVILVVTGSLFLYAFLARPSSRPEEKRGGYTGYIGAGPVETREQAVQRAFSLTGFYQIKGVKASAERATLSDAEDCTPFLHDRVVNREVWRVAFAGICLRGRRGEREFENPFIKAFDIYLDPETGQLLKAVSQWPEGEPPLEQHRQIATYMERHFSEERRYRGFPAEDPGVDLRRALMNALAGSVGNPAEAREITAHYVLSGVDLTPEGREPRPLWVVTLRGTAVSFVSGGGFGSVGTAPLRYFRIQIDGRTGKLCGEAASSEP